MIKIALKHFVCEICINQFFTIINENFVPTPLNPYNIKKGEVYRRIVYIDNNGERKNLYDATIQKNDIKVDGSFLTDKRDSQRCFCGWIYVRTVVDLRK